jgi:hypothetical protein
MTIGETLRVTVDNCWAVGRDRDTCGIVGSVVGRKGDGSVHSERKANEGACERERERRGGDEQDHKHGS